MIVCVEVGGKVYWFDGMWLGDCCIFDFEVLLFVWVLLFKFVGGVLEVLKVVFKIVFNSVYLLNFDVIKGIMIFVCVWVEVIFIGDVGFMMCVSFFVVDKGVFE